MDDMLIHAPSVRPYIDIPLLFPCSNGMMMGTKGESLLPFENISLLTTAYLQYRRRQNVLKVLKIIRNERECIFRSFLPPGYKSMLLGKGTKEKNRGFFLQRFHIV